MDEIMKLFTKYLYDVKNEHGQLEKFYRVYKIGFKWQNQTAWFSVYYEEVCIIEQFCYAKEIWAI